MSWALIPLTEDQRLIQRMVAEFAAEHITPCAAKWDREEHFERRVIDGMGKLGFLGMMLP
jgi:butyryl-CoA dehydrogenase